jgi:hypothetical protein
LQEEGQLPTSLLSSPNFVGAIPFKIRKDCIHFLSIKMTTRKQSLSIVSLLLLCCMGFSFLSTSSTCTRKFSTCVFFQEPSKEPSKEPYEEKKKKNDMDIGTLFEHLFESSTAQKKTNKLIIMPKHQNVNNFQQRLLQAKLEMDFKASKSKENQRDFQERLLQAKLKMERKQRQRYYVQKSLKHIRILKHFNETALGLASPVEEAKQKAQGALGEARKTKEENRLLIDKNRKCKQSQFQQRMLRAKLQCDVRAKEFKQQQRLITESKRKNYRFHQRMLTAKLENDTRANKFNTRRLLHEIRVLEEEEKKRQEYKQRMTIFQQQLLATRIQNDERAKEFKQRRLLQQILKELERQKKHQQYLFQSQLLAASIYYDVKAKEQQKQKRLNSILQNQHIISYTKKKIGEKTKFKFQRNLLSNTIQNEKSARKKQRGLENKRGKNQFQQRLMEQRINSQLKKEAERIKKQQQTEFQNKLMQFYKALEQLQQAKKHNILDKKKRNLKWSEFQERLLSARIRNDLISKQRIAKKRIDELYQSLVEAQQQSEIAAAQVAKAEEEKRSAQLELEKESSEQGVLREQQRKEALQQKIMNSQKRQEELRKKMEDAGRQQTGEDSSSSTMDEYSATMERQRREAIQRGINKSQQQQEQLRRRHIGGAGQHLSKEEILSGTMNQYEATLQSQQEEEFHSQMEGAKRRQEMLRKEMENTGRQQQSFEGGESMDRYLSWMKQVNKTLSPLFSAAPPTTTSPVKASEDKFREELEQAGRPISSEERQHPPRLTEQQASQIMVEQEISQSQTASQQEQAAQHEEDVLVGQVLLSKFYITEKLRVGGDRSELYKCYHIQDKVQQQYPLVIKLSHNTEQIELEHRIYGDLFSRLTLDRQSLFVKAYDWVGASPLTNGRVGFVMECGLENLRGYIWRHGAFQGEKLRNAMENVIRIVQSLHGLGVIWVCSNSTFTFCLYPTLYSNLYSHPCFVFRLN